MIQKEPQLSLILRFIDWNRKNTPNLIFFLNNLKIIVILAAD
jgi:hypothetical protein